MGAVTAGLLARGTAAAPPPKGIVLTPIGVYRSSHFNAGGAEIAAYDAATKRVFIVNLADQRVDVVDISAPASPFLADVIDITPWGAQANSVAVHDGVVAVAIEALVKTDPGTVAFFTAAGVPLSAVTVGALPDMLTFTPNGQLVLDGQRGRAKQLQPGRLRRSGRQREHHRPARRRRRGLTQADVTTAGFTAFNSAVLDPSIRIYGPNATVGSGPRAGIHRRLTRLPHRVGDAAGKQRTRDRWTCARNEVTTLVGLGFKDHSLPGNGLDSSDRDGHAINIQTRPVSRYVSARRHRQLPPAGTDLPDHRQ